METLTVQVIAIEDMERQLITESLDNFFVKFHDSDYIVKSKFVNFSPRNKSELAGLLTKGKYPIIRVTRFMLESNSQEEAERGLSPPPNWKRREPSLIFLSGR